MNQNQDFFLGKTGSVPTPQSCLSDSPLFPLATGCTCTVLSDMIVGFSLLTKPCNGPLIIFLLPALPVLRRKRFRTACATSPSLLSQIPDSYRALYTKQNSSRSAYNAINHEDSADPDAIRFWLTKLLKMIECSSLRGRESELGSLKL